jgi:uncharacterized UBP type Zn finger protein
MEKADVSRILAEVHANIAALNGCPGPHVFEDSTPDANLLQKLWKCVHCGGTVRGREKHWYESGLAHGKASSVPRP